MREMHHIASIIYDRSDPDCKRRAHALLRDLVLDAAKVGYGEYNSSHYARSSGKYIQLD